MLPARGERGGEPTPAAGGDRSRGHGHGAADRQLASQSKVWSAKKWIYRGESKARTYHLSVRSSSPLAAESLNYSRVSLLLPDRGRDDVCRGGGLCSVMAWRHDAIGVGRGSFIAPASGRWRERERERERGVASCVCHRPPPFCSSLLILKKTTCGSSVKTRDLPRRGVIYASCFYLTKFTAVSFLTDTHADADKRRAGH